jgi:hypothetical protein
MPEEEDRRRFRLHFEGPSTRAHTLPASALLQALQQFQRVVHLLAMAREGREVRQRARITQEIERRFRLVCGVPAADSYALPLDLGDTSHELFDVLDVAQVADTTRAVLRAVNDADQAEIARLIPDRGFRASVLAGFDAMQPPHRAGIVVSIEDHRAQKLLDGATARSRIEALRARPQPELAPPPSYVTGRLIEMKFQERRLRLQLLGSNKSLDASYSDDFEPVLLQHPRDLIQVHGNVVFGEDGAPTSISDVDDILEVDVSAIEVRSLEIGNRTVRPRHPLSFFVSFDQDGKVYEATGPFDMVLGAETRPELEAQLDAELAMLWREYALAAPATLTAAAQRLREELLTTFEDATDAT